MKFPIQLDPSHEGHFLGFDSERERLCLIGSDGKVLKSITWETLIRLIHAKKREQAGADNRQTPRAGLALKIAYHTPNGRKMMSVTRDIGAGGVFIETGMPLPRGTELEVEFSLPHPPFDSVSARARVAWSRDSAERHVLLPGMGLQFTEIRTEARERITQFVTHLNEARGVA